MNISKNHIKQIYIILYNQYSLSKNRIKKQNQQWTLTQ